MAIIALIGPNAGRGPRVLLMGGQRRPSTIQLGAGVLPSPFRSRWRCWPPASATSTGLILFAIISWRRQRQISSTILRGMSVPEFIGPEGYGVVPGARSPCRPMSCALPDCCFAPLVWDAFGAASPFGGDWRAHHAGHPRRGGHGKSYAPGLASSPTRRREAATTMGDSYAAIPVARVGIVSVLLLDWLTPGSSHPRWWPSPPARSCSCGAGACTGCPRAQGAVLERDGTALPFIAHPPGLLRGTDVLHPPHPAPGAASPGRWWSWRPILVPPCAPACRRRAALAARCSRDLVGRGVEAVLTHRILVPVLFVFLVVVWLLPTVQFYSMLDWRLYRLMNWSVVITGSWWLEPDPDRRPGPPAAMSPGDGCISPIFDDGAANGGRRVYRAYAARSLSLVRIMRRAIPMPVLMDQSIGGLDDEDSGGAGGVDRALVASAGLMRLSGGRLPSRESGAGGSGWRHHRDLPALGRLFLCPAPVPWYLRPSATVSSNMPCA